MGIFSSFFGTPSDDQVDRDVQKGSAEPRNDVEDDAASSYVDEALSSGKDPIPDQVPDWASDLPSPGEK